VDWLRRWGGKVLADWAAALIGTVSLLPGLAAVSTVIAVLLVGDPSPDSAQSSFVRVLAVGLGFLVGAAAWLIFAFLIRRYAQVDRANLRMHAELVQRLLSAEAAHSRLCPPDGTDESSAGPCDEAGRHLASLRVALGGPDIAALAGPEWVLGSGYVAAWQQLHRAEEALLLLASRHELAEQAMHDARRLQGSGIPHQQQQLALLRAAVSALSPGLAAYFPGKVPATGETPPAAQLSEADGRAVVRQTRRLINEYRDDASAGLVTLRRRLMQSVVFTGLTAYLVLGLAVVAAVPIVAVVSAAALYLVGALVGLLQRLHAESGLHGERQLDDYGLTTAKMIHLALLSGMAAVAGVVLVGLLSGAALTEVLQPLPEGETNVIALSQIFDLRTYPIGIILAALFGLTPGLLLTRLGRQGEVLTEKLESSEAGAGNGEEQAEV
jgi:hypothetical protein